MEKKKWLSLAGKPVSPTKKKLPLEGIFFKKTEFIPSIFRKYFRQVETFFVTNSSFRLVETERVFFHLEPS